QWHPALRALRNPAKRQRRVPPDPNRDLPIRRRQRDYVARFEMAALIVKRLTGPVQCQHIERLVEQRVAFLEVDAERAELRLEIAGAHPEHEPTAGQQI